MRTPLVIGNWKMHGTVAEARALATGIRDGLKRPRGVQVVVCPPFTALAAVSELLTGSPIQLGAQTCHHEPSGAHTGEISVPMLTELACRWMTLRFASRVERAQELAAAGGHEFATLSLEEQDRYYRLAKEALA